MNCDFPPIFPLRPFREMCYTSIRYHGWASRAADGAGPPKEQRNKWKIWKMPTFYPAVRAQVDYAFALLGFIKRLLRAVLPGLSRDKRILGTKKDFTGQIDAAFADIDPHGAKVEDYRLAVVAAACAEVSNLCALLTNACNCTGFSEIASRYLSPRRFMFMLVKCDGAKLKALLSAVESGGRDVGRILMRVGAVLDGRPDTYDRMDDAAKRKAATDSRRILDEVRTLAKRIDDGRDEIIGHVDAVAAKVGGLGSRGKRKSRYGGAVREVCLAYWNAAQNNADIRYSINTRITYKAVFGYFAKELSAHGVTSAEQFRQALHSAHNLECLERRRKLDKQRDGRKRSGKTGLTGFAT